MKNLRRCSLAFGTLALVCVLARLPAYAQVTTAPELKAAFLLNFLKFTRWPVAAAPEGGALRLCVLGDNRVVVALDEITRDQHIENRAIVVVALADQGDAQGCHLLYVSGLSAEREQILVESTRGKPILSASDSNSFMKRGGVAAFYVTGGKMKFAVNPSAAERSQLRISSKLLSLAVIVKDADDAKIR